MDKYRKIEAGNGFHLNVSYPIDINDRFGQARLKDTAWRMTEELGESLDSYLDNPDGFLDEMADVMHFLAEFTLLAGYVAHDVVDWTYGDNSDILLTLFLEAEASGYGDQYEDLTHQTGLMVQSLAMTCNTLKNKPWKQTPKETDVNLFKSRLQKTWSNYAALCITAGINDVKLFECYLKKAAVNENRQNTGY
jgi:hypothetical protein